MAGFLIIAATALLWVFVFRIVKQRQIAAHRAFLDSLQPGDRVTTAGGIFGTIVEVDGQRCRLEIAPGVVIDLVPVVINRRLSSAPADAPSTPSGDGATTDAADVTLEKD